MKRFLLLLSIFSVILFGCTVNLYESTETQISEIKAYSDNNDIKVADTFSIVVKASDGRELNDISIDQKDSALEFIELNKKANSYKFTFLALKKGNAKVSFIESNTNKKSSIDLKIKDVSSLNISLSNVNITKGDEKVISVSTSDNRTLHPLKWEVATKGVVSIENISNDTVKILALNEGSTNIKVTEEGTGKTGTVKITVNEKPVIEEPGILTISTTSSSLIIGEEATLTLSSSKNDLGTVIWSVEGDCIEKVSSTSNSYIIKAINKGSSIITATDKATNRKATITINVLDAYINVLDESSNAIIDTIILDFENNKSKTLTYEIKSKTTNKLAPIVTWSILENDYKNYFDISGKNNTITINVLDTNVFSIPTFTLVLKADLTSSYSISQTVKFTAKPKTLSDISISSTPSVSEITMGDEITFNVTTSDNRELEKINWSITPNNLVQINSTTPQSITVKSIGKGLITVSASEEKTGKISNNISLNIKEKLIQYRLNIGQSGNTNEIIPSYIELTEDYKIDIRAFDNDNNVIKVNFVSPKVLTQDVRTDFITTNPKTYSTEVILHYDRIDEGREVQVRFVVGVGLEEINTDVYTIKKVSKKPLPPSPNPEEGGGSNPGTKPSDKLEIGKTLIIPHDYGKEKVKWLGGIEPPTEFLDYEFSGKIEEDRDENGNIIEGSGVQATESVPKYYVVDSNKETTSNKPSWYNVTKSMVENTDSALCWAMSSAGALHWWFDYIGQDYTDKLFEIRRNRTDIKPSAKFVLDDLNGKDTHYTPLPKEESGDVVSKKSGIGSYAVKSFFNKGGQPLNLFRLYFLDEDANANKFENYKKQRSLGLLSGYGYLPSGYNQNDESDKLFEVVSLSNRPKNDIVNIFKQAIDEEAAIVLHQANIPDSVLGDTANGPHEAHHAIILWGVIFDEKEENIVGLYIGDNNLKEGNLARVDLVYKQLSENGGRYYYASPFVSQQSDKYLKQTSITTITKLYPPKESVKVWIDEMYNKTVKQKN